MSQKFRRKKIVRHFFQTRSEKKNSGTEKNSSKTETFESKNWKPGVVTLFRRNHFKVAAVDVVDIVDVADVVVDIVVAVVDVVAAGSN